MERDFTEERYQQELARGRIEGDDFITASGATVRMWTPQPDDDELIDPGCVYCMGAGENFDEEYYGQGSTGCYACNGTGKANYTITLGEQRKLAWLDTIFFTDAPRFEMMDRDICPDCGHGGCGGECHWTEEEWEKYAGPESDEAPPLSDEQIEQWRTQALESLAMIEREIPF